jgi:hypothetical protein
MYISDTTTWYLERLIRVIAGTFIIGSVLLGYFVSADWFAFAGVVGVLLLIFGLTGFCPMNIFYCTPLERGSDAKVELRLRRR